MRELSMQSDLPEGPPVDHLDGVRKLQITYSRIRPGAGTCFVEHAGGRIEVFEVDRFLIERLLDYLESLDPEPSPTDRDPG